MTRPETREEKCAKQFLCVCGSTLVFEWNGEGQCRIVCFDRLGGREQPCQHNEPTAWCATRQDAIQLREVLRAMTRV